MSKYWISEIPSLAATDFSLPLFLSLSVNSKQRHFTSTLRHKHRFMKQINTWREWRQKHRGEDNETPLARIALQVFQWVGGHLWKKAWLCSWFFGEWYAWTCRDLRCLQGPFTFLIHSPPPLLIFPSLFLTSSCLFLSKNERLEGSPGQRGRSWGWPSVCCVVLFLSVRSVTAAFLLLLDVQFYLQGVFFAMQSQETWAGVCWLKGMIPLYYSMGFYLIFSHCFHKVAK